MVRIIEAIPADVSPRRRLFFVALIVGLVLSSRLSSAQDVAGEDVANEWPALRLGIWESVSKRVLPSGETKNLETPFASLPSRSFHVLGILGTQTSWHWRLCLGIQEAVR